MKNNLNFIKKWKEFCNDDPRNFLMENLWENSIYQSLRDNVNNQPRLRSSSYCANLMEKFYVNILDPLIKSDDYKFINGLSEFVSSIFNSKSERFIFDQYMADEIDFCPSKTENEYYHFMNLISILVKNYKLEIPMKFHNVNYGKINFNIIGIDKDYLIKMINSITPSQDQNFAFEDGLYNLINALRSSIDERGTYVCSNISILNMEKTNYTTWQLFCSERLMLASPQNFRLLLLSLIASYSAIFMELNERLHCWDKIKILSLINSDKVSFNVASDLISIILYSKFLIANNIDPFELNLDYNDLVNISDLKRFIFDENINGLHIDSDSSTFYNDELKILSFKL